MTRYIVAAGLLAALTFSQNGCTPQERQDIVNDAGAYAGAPDPEGDGVFNPFDVGAEIGKDVASKASDPAELAIYLAGLAVLVGVGYVKRKFIQKVYSKALGKE